MTNCPASSKDMPNETKTALVVDDDQGVSDLLCRILARTGFNVHSAFSCQSATTLILKNTFNLILLDINLPDGCGLDLIAEMKELHPNVTLITMTGDDPQWMVDQAKALNVAHHLNKPFEIQNLLETFNNIATELDKGLKDT